MKFILCFIFYFVFSSFIYAELTYTKIIDPKKQTIERIFYKDKKEIGRIVENKQTFKKTVQGIIPKGIVKYYDPDNGILREEVTYENGKKNGNAKIYDKYGFIKQNSFYKNDILDGLVQIYENNKVTQEWSYSNGFLDGLAKTYDKDGNLKKREFTKKIN